MLIAALSIAMILSLSIATLVSLSNEQDRSRAKAKVFQERY